MNADLFGAFLGPLVLMAGVRFLFATIRSLGQ